MGSKVTIFYLEKDLLKKTVEEDASDLHITVGSPPRIRKGGKVIPISDIKLSPDETKSLIVSEINSQNKAKLDSGSEIDFSISVPGISRFRVNVFSQRGNWAAAYRRLPFEIPSILTTEIIFPIPFSVAE